MEHLRARVPTRFKCVTRDTGSGEEGDPQELEFQIGRVGHPPTKYQLSNGGVKRDGPGRFHVDLTPKAAGQWAYRWRAYGAQVTQSDEVRFVLDGAELVT